MTDAEFWAKYDIKEMTFTGVYPIGAPFHSDIASEKDEKPKNDNDDRDYVPIGAPYHHNND